LGAALYPRDARSPEDLLAAAGQALEAAFETESPSAIVFAGKNALRGGGRKGSSQSTP
jgi:predicted signal transduction protein with EAL and GGDEF domain